MFRVFFILRIRMESLCANVCTYKCNECFLFKFKREMYIRVYDAEQILEAKGYKMIDMDAES